MTRGDKIRSLLEAKGWTLSKLGRAADVSRPGLYKIMSGASNGSLATLNRIAFALGVDVSGLIDPNPDTPDPVTVTLSRCRDLASQDDTDRAEHFRQVVEMEWMLTFQGPTQSSGS